MSDPRGTTYERIEELERERDEYAEAMQKNHDRAVAQHSRADRAEAERDALRAERDEAVKASKYASDTGVRDRIARRKAEASVTGMIRSLHPMTWPCGGDGALYCADVDECGECLRAQDVDRVLDAYRATSEKETTDAE